MTGFVHSPRSDLGDPEPSTLVEAEGVEVVVGRHQPEAMCLGTSVDGVHQHRANALVPVHDLDVHDLDVGAVGVEGHDANRLTVPLGDESRAGKRVDGRPEPDLKASAETIAEEPFGPWPIRVGECPNGYLSHCPSVATAR